MRRDNAESEWMSETASISLEAVSDITISYNRLLQFRKNSTYSRLRHTMPLCNCTHFSTYEHRPVHFFLFLFAMLLFVCVSRCIARHWRCIITFSALMFATATCKWFIFSKRLTASPVLYCWRKMHRCRKEVSTDNKQRNHQVTSDNVLCRARAICSSADFKGRRYSTLLLFLFLMPAKQQLNGINHAAY